MLDIFRHTKTRANEGQDQKTRLFAEVCEDFRRYFQHAQSFVWRIQQSQERCCTKERQRRSTWFLCSEVLANCAPVQNHPKKDNSYNNSSLTLSTSFSYRCAMRTNNYSCLCVSLFRQLIKKLNKLDVTSSAVENPGMVSELIKLNESNRAKILKNPKRRRCLLEKIQDGNKDVLGKVTLLII